VTHLLFAIVDVQDHRLGGWDTVHRLSGQVFRLIYTPVFERLFVRDYRTQVNRYQKGKNSLDFMRQ